MHIGFQPFPIVTSALEGVLADPGNLARAVSTFTAEVDSAITDLEGALRPHLDKRADLEKQMQRLDVRFQMGRIDEPEYRECIEAHQTALVRIGKRSKSREAKLIELEILRTQRAEIEAVVSSLDAWDDDADPRAWREMFSELTGLKGEPKWRRLFSLFEPSIEVGLDGDVEIRATLPGRDSLRIVLDGDGELRNSVQFSR